jgi:hypothetical protein
LNQNFGNFSILKVQLNMSESTEQIPATTENPSTNEFDDPDYHDAKEPPQADATEDLAEPEAPAIVEKFAKSSLTHRNL